MSQAFPRQTSPRDPGLVRRRARVDILSLADTASPGFFETVGTPLIAGRFFTWSDSAAAARVCIVTESLARKLRPNADVLQRRIRFGTLRDRQDMTIVGVVGNLNLGNLRPPIAFVPPALSGANFSAEHPDCNDQ